jgi:hypothetical protein
MAGRPSKKLETDQLSEPEIESKYINWYDAEDTHFESDDQEDLFDGLPSNDYNRIQELDSDEWGDG